MLPAFQALIVATLVLPSTLEWNAAPTTTTVSPFLLSLITTSLLVLPTSVDMPTWLAVVNLKCRRCMAQICMVNILNRVTLSMMRMADTIDA